MKVRSGFVSNSSSSSFVVVTTRENHERAMALMHPYVRAVVNKVVSSTQFAGREVVYWGDMNVMDSGGYLFDFTVPWSEDFPTSEYTGGTYTLEGVQETFEHYEAELIRNKADVFSFHLEG